MQDVSRSLHRPGVSRRTVSRASSRIRLWYELVGVSRYMFEDPRKNKWLHPSLASAVETFTVNAIVVAEEVHPACAVRRCRRRLLHHHRDNAGAHATGLQRQDCVIEPGPRSVSAPRRSVGRNLPCGGAALPVRPSGGGTVCGRGHSQDCPIRCCGPIAVLVAPVIGDSNSRARSRGLINLNQLASEPSTGGREASASNSVHPQPQAAEPPPTALRHHCANESSRQSTPLVASMIHLHFRIDRLDSQ